MGIDDLMARLDRILAEQGLGGAARQQAGLLHDALVDHKVALKDLAEALEKTRKNLDAERVLLADAERRGGLAAGIGDAETAEIARQFVEKHQSRVDLLERKLAVQQDELATAQRDYDILTEKYRAARQGVPTGGPPPGGIEPDPEAELLKAKMDRRAAESAVDAQLEQLKRKLGKNG